MFKVFKSSKPSSKRTRATDTAHIMGYENISRTARKKRRYRSNRNQARLNDELQMIDIDDYVEYGLVDEKLWKTNTLVVDGSSDCLNISNICTKNKQGKNTHPLKSLSISHGDIKAVDTENRNKGIACKEDAEYVFIHVPRKAAIEVTQMKSESVGRSMVTSLRNGMKAQKGKITKIFDTV